MPESGSGRGLRLAGAMAAALLAAGGLASESDPTYAALRGAKPDG